MLSLVEFIVVAICGIISLVYYLWYTASYLMMQKMKWLPTIPGWPIIGNALELKDLTTTMSNLIKLTPRKEKLILLDVLHQPILFASDYDFAEFILSSQKIITKSLQYRYYENWLGTGLLLSGGSKWKSRRRIITPAFHFSILDEFLEIFEANGDIFIKKLSKLVDMESIDIHNLFGLYALDVISETAMGVKLYAQTDADSEYVKNVKLMCRLTMERSISIMKKSDWLYLLSPDYYRERKAVNMMHNFTNEVIKERRQSQLSADNKEMVDEFGRKKKMAFLDILLKATIDGKPLSQEDIREEVDTFMFEGHDTTSSALSFCTYFLAENPDVQERAVQEQLEIFDDDISRQSTSQDLQNMKYLEYIIKETLRLCPSVPLYGRFVDEDVYFKGNLLPKGLDIMIFAYAMHHDSDYFPDPEKFDPSRFENLDSKKPYLFIPFSAGPRNCIGQRFGMLEMKSILSKLLRNFKILPTVPKHYLILSPETILKSVNGVRIKLAPRQL